jgi:probable rRNA maturation factor
VRARVPAQVVRECARQVERAMRAAAVRDEVALSLVRDREVRALNREYAGEDHATDVLSFSQREQVRGAARVRGGAGAGAGPLGDIVISVETARRQAAAGGRALVDELVHLAVHGLAHLCGYDHATRADERVMFGWETKLRAQATARGAVRRVPRP